MAKQRVAEERWKRTFELALEKQAEVAEEEEAGALQTRAAALKSNDRPWMKRAAEPSPHGER
jgi:hypothetical protein